MAPAGVSKKDRQAEKAKTVYDVMMKEAEDASWQESDKRAAMRECRLKEKEAKHDAKLVSKMERKALEEAEMEQMQIQHEKRAPPAKLTQAEIARRQALMAASVARPKSKATSAVVEQPRLEPNLNRRNSGHIEASSVHEAVHAITNLDKGVRPSAMTFAEFEKRTLAELREEKPGLKLSQLKEQVFKLWARSPENPSRLS
mmetsp:Transcript_83115/g.173993  ORF Transcript_83115/g.173993 Transcript_83115/m.173993 type:complete len:201 (+) Transcript_83115:170-772(+)|eukprot:CAMPEP_0206478676 /NCGR_PEP_ID=MMETSP0324_2-20121206/36212_1 /ASSEMBLY_ACC=CAM_ASM_000836 /TAXON_ID=2866 /ORGANISM="Crypthecodinium cohnii, Strain Seligo" /LENGTH=200 /DNA_ID=CAMNT_0053955061 /DNA_START=97 /DNA_END=699 /DNA_ORIENTATION=+